MKRIISLSEQQINELESQAEALIYLVHQLADIQEAFIMDAEQLLINAGDYRFNIKRDITKVKHLTGSLREQVWKKNQDNIDAVELFGEESDSLRNVIQNFFFDLAKTEHYE